MKKRNKRGRSHARGHKKEDVNWNGEGLKEQIWRQETLSVHLVQL